MPVQVKTSASLRMPGLKAIEKDFKKLKSRGPKHNPYRDIINDTIDAYFKYWQDRLKARGHGQFPPLADTTLRWRKHKYGITHTRPLFASMTLFRGLKKGEPGHYRRITKKGAFFGYGGQGKHPEGFSVKEMAMLHADAVGRRPKRQIIVMPSSKVQKAIATRTKRKWGKYVRRHK